MTLATLTARPARLLKAVGAAFESLDLPHAMLDIMAVLFGLFFIALYVGAVALSIFVLLVAVVQ